MIDIDITLTGADAGNFGWGGCSFECSVPPVKLPCFANALLEKTITNQRVTKQLFGAQL